MISEKELADLSYPDAPKFDSSEFPGPKSVLKLNLIINLKLNLRKKKRSEMHFPGWYVDFRFCFPP